MVIPRVVRAEESPIPSEPPTGSGKEARPRGLFSDLIRAFGWRRETQSMVTWRGFAFGAANTAVNNWAVAALLYCGHPRMAFWMFVYHVFSWAAFLWLFAVRRRSEMNVVERTALAVHVGGILAILISVPLILATRGPDVLTLYPLYNAVAGCVVFVHGAIHRGQDYARGLLWMSQNLLLPFLPGWAWAALHASVGGAVNLWAAVTSWRIDRAGRAAREGW